MPKKRKVTLPEETVIKEKKEEFILATGKRKSAIAQIKLKPEGQGKIIINQKDFKEYFPYFAWQKIVLDPLEAVNLKNADLMIKVKGGGVNSQAESIRLGISRALIQYNPEFKKILKPFEFLTRDARIKERKKPGLKRARRAPQWQKR